MRFAAVCYWKYKPNFHLQRKQLTACTQQIEYYRFIRSFILYVTSVLWCLSRHVLSAKKVHKTETFHSALFCISNNFEGRWNLGRLYLCSGLTGHLASQVHRVIWSDVSSQWALSLCPAKTVLRCEEPHITTDDPVGTEQYGSIPEGQ